MSILNLSVSLTSYNSSGAGCNVTNNPNQVNFQWFRSISNIPSDNILSQSLTIPTDSTSTLFNTPTAISSSFTGIIPGSSTSVTLTANTPGTAGDLISLVFDGSSISISSAIATWNAANSSNQVTLTSGDGTQIPTIAQTVSLNGGTDRVVYSFIYMETDSQVSVLINGTETLVINPIIIGTSIFSGILMLTCDITSLVVTNASATNPADIFFAAVE
jgi:hypothetical protein